MTWLCKNKTLWVGAKLQGYLFYWKATSLLQEKVGDVLQCTVFSMAYKRGQYMLVGVGWVKV